MPSITAFFSVIVLCFLNSCGFTPLYGTHSQHAHMPLISVDAPESRHGQIFTHDLLTHLYGERNQPPQPDYLLSVNLSEEQFPIDIRRDRTVTRFRIRLRGHYVLTRIEDGHMVDKGSIVQTGGYDRVNSDYATYVSGRALKERAAEALAEDFRRYLIGYFSSRHQHTDHHQTSRINNN